MTKGKMDRGRHGKAPKKGKNKNKKTMDATEIRELRVREFQQAKRAEKGAELGSLEDLTLDPTVSFEAFEKRAEPLIEALYERKYDEIKAAEIERLRKQQARKKERLDVMMQKAIAVATKLAKVDAMKRFAEEREANLE